jgi:hypothetical protein
MRVINVLVVVVAATLSAGCDRRAANAVAEQIGPAIQENIREMGRQELARQFGPTVLSSLVGAAAPPGGPLCLLATDAGWQQCADASAADTDAVDPPPEGPPVSLRMFFKAPPRDPNP